MKTQRGWFSKDTVPSSNVVDLFYVEINGHEVLLIGEAMQTAAAYRRSYFACK